MNRPRPKGDGAQSLAVPNLGEGMLRVSILTELPPLLRELGYDPDPVLAEAGLDPALLNRPDNTIPFHAVGALIEHCVTRTGCHHFGLLLGQRGGATTLGLVGLLARNSPDVGTALRALIKYLHHHDRGAIPTLTVTGGFAVFGYAIYEHEVPSSDQIYAASVAIAFQIMRELCGAEWRPSEVLFPFRKPHDPDVFKRFFQVRPRFGAQQAALVFPASCLERAVSEADPEVRRAVETLLEGSRGTDLAAGVRRTIRGMLARGGVTEETLARAHAMSRRTLIRRLQDQGTPFRTVLKDVRMDMACQLLRDTDNPVANIAIGLGYAGASPFTRAFKRWTGLTPGAWRTRHAPRAT